MQALAPLPLLRITPISPISAPSSTSPLYPSFSKPNSNPINYPSQHVDLPNFVSLQNRNTAVNAPMPIQSPIQTQLRRISIVDNVNYPFIVDPKKESYSPNSLHTPKPLTDPKYVPLLREGRNHPLIINNLTLNPPAQTNYNTNIPNQRWTVTSQQPQIPVFKTKPQKVVPDPVFQIPTQKMTIRIQQKQNSAAKLPPPKHFQLTQFPNITLVSTPPSQASNPPTSKLAAQKIKLKKRITTPVQTPLTPRTLKDSPYKVDTSHWQDNEQKPVLKALNSQQIESMLNNLGPVAQPPKSKSLQFQQIKSMFYKIGIQPHENNLVSSKIEPLSQISMGQSLNVETNDMQIQTVEQPLLQNNISVQIQLPYEDSIPELETSNKVYYKSRRNIFPQEAFEPLAQVIPQILRLKPTSEAIAAPTFSKPTMRLSLNQQKLNLFPNKQQSKLKDKPIALRQYQYQLQPVLPKQSKPTPELERDTLWYERVIPPYPDTPTRQKQLDFCPAVQQNIQSKQLSFSQRPPDNYKSNFSSNSIQVQSNNQMGQQQVVMVPVYQHLLPAQSQYYPMNYQFPFGQMYNSQMVWQQGMGQPLDEVLVYLFLNQDGKSRLKQIEIGNYIQKQNCVSVQESNRKIESLMQMISMSRLGKQLSEQELKGKMQQFHELMQSQARENEQVQIDLTQIVVKQ